MSVKVKGISSWIHCTQIKWAPGPEWTVESTRPLQMKRQLQMNNKMYRLMFMEIILSLGSDVEEN